MFKKRSPNQKESSNEISIQDIEGVQRIIRHALRPIIFLIVIPIISIIITIIGVLGLDSSRIYSIDSILVITGISIFILTFCYLYILIPLPRSVKKYFEKNGMIKTLVEYKIITKILYFSIPLTIVGNIILLVPFGEKSLIEELFVGYLHTNTDHSSIIKGKQILTLFFITSTAATISQIGLIKYGFLTVQKDFRYFLTKSALKFSSELSNEREKMRFTIFAISSYNKFLKRHLKIQINDPVKIIQTILADSSEKMNNSINTMYENCNEDKLELLRYLQKTYSDKEDFLVSYTIRQRIMEDSPLVATIISILVFIVEVLPKVLETSQIK